jgi:uncharacterized protein (TIGR00251 family)
LKQSLTLIVHVVPRSKTTEIAGRYGDAIRIRVAAPPEDGAANAELIRFLAKVLRVSKRDIAIVGGTRGRRKIVSVAGVSAADAKQLMADS